MISFVDVDESATGSGAPAAAPAAAAAAAAVATVAQCCRLQKRRIEPTHRPLSQWVVGRPRFESVDDLCQRHDDTSSSHGDAEGDDEPAQALEASDDAMCGDVLARFDDSCSDAATQDAKRRRLDPAPTQSTALPRPDAPATPTAEFGGDLIMLLAAAREDQAVAAGVPKEVWSSAVECARRDVERRRELKEAESMRRQSEGRRTEAEQELSSLTAFAVTVFTDAAKRTRRRLRRDAAVRRTELGATTDGECESLRQAREVILGLESRRDRLAAFIDGPAARPTAGQRDSADRGWSEPPQVQFLTDQIEYQTVGVRLQEERKKLASLQVELAVASREWDRQRCEDCSEYRSFKPLQNRYVPLTLIGRGQRSECWEAFDCQEQRNVVVQVCSPDPAWSEEEGACFLRCVRRRAELQQSVECDHVLPVIDIFEAEYPPAVAVVTGVCGDGDLEAHLRSRPSGLISEDDSRLCILQILWALYRLSKAKTSIVHNHITASSIVFSNPGHVLLCDFKHAAEVGAVDECPCSECMRRPKTPATPKSDVLAAGALLHRMLFGVNPPADLADVPREPRVTEQMRDVLGRMLDPDEAARATVEELLDHEYFDATGGSLVTRDGEYGGVILKE